MIPRWVTAAYLLYLVAPVVLLVVGSFGESWFNTLLPSGATTRWYVQVAGDPSFRRAFASSLFVATMTCLACVAIGLPLAYAVYRAESRRVRAVARALYQLPVALPALVLAFGFILVFSSDALPWLGSPWLLIAGHIALGLPYLLQVSCGQRALTAGVVFRAEDRAGPFFSRFKPSFANRTAGHSRPHPGLASRFSRRDCAGAQEHRQQGSGLRRHSGVC